MGLARRILGFAGFVASAALVHFRELGPSLGISVPEFSLGPPSGAARLAQHARVQDGYPLGTSLVGSPPQCVRSAASVPPYGVLLAAGWSRLQRRCAMAP